MCPVLHLIRERTKILRLRLLQQEEKKILQRLRKLNRKRYRKRYIQQKLTVVMLVNSGLKKVHKSTTL